MAYVEAHASLREHPKTKKMARLLGISRAATIGHMLCLWWWCQEYAEDGDLSAYEPEDIAEAADWDGDPSSFLDVLLNCGMKGRNGFLAENEDGTLFVKDWHEYGGKLSIKRAQARERMRTLRDRDNSVTRNTRVTGANVTHYVTHPLRNVTHIDQTRVDQSRSDKSRQDQTEQNANIKNANANAENANADSVCLSDCLSDATLILKQHNIDETPHKIKNTAQAIADFGLTTVQDAYSIAADKGKEREWNYVKGVVKRLAQPVNGVHIVNGKRDISSLIGEIPEDVV